MHGGVLMAADKSSNRKSPPFIRHNSVSPHGAALWHGQLGGKSPGNEMQRDLSNLWTMKATATDEGLIAQPRQESTQTGKATYSMVRHKARRSWKAATERTTPQQAPATVLPRITPSCWRNDLAALSVRILPFT